MFLVFQFLIQHAGVLIVFSYDDNNIVIIIVGNNNAQS